MKNQLSMKFNSLQYRKIDFDENLTAQALSTNKQYDQIKKEYLSKFNLPNAKSFSFTKDGFFSIFMQLDGLIAVSLGESEAIVSGAELANKFGKEIVFLDLNKDGSVDLSLVNDSFNFIFISSYVTDTYFKTNLEKIKSLSKAQIISNITAATDYSYSDVLLLDGYKLCGQGEYGVIIYDEQFEESYLGQININTLDLCLKSLNNRTLNNNQKYKFLEKFEEYFSDDLYIFVDPKLCLDYTLHLGLRDIKARELIRSLSLHNIFLNEKSNFDNSQTTFANFVNF